MHKLDSSMKQVETLRVELAAYYCEDDSSFLLDDAFKVIRAFCDKLQKAIKVFARIVFVSKHTLNSKWDSRHSIKLGLCSLGTPRS